MLKKKLAAVVLGISLICSLCSCGRGNQGGKVSTDSETNKDLKEITMVLDWTPNTNHTGLYVAQEMGYFEEAGLQVSLVQPPDGGATDMVASGGAQFGVDFQDYLAPAFGTEDPLPVTAVAAILQHNTSGLVSLKEKGIDSPGKLEGHSYATWDLPIEQAVLKNVMEADGGSFDKVNLISTYVEDILAALNTEIECVWIYHGWDGIKLEQEGIETNYLSFAEMNPVFDYYSPVIIANNVFLQENPESAKAFLSAVKKGYKYAVENPEEAAEILLKAAPELDEELVNASQAYLSTQYIAEAESWGHIESERWNGYYSWLNENGLVEQEIPENAGFSNEYLPK